MPDPVKQFRTYLCSKGIQDEDQIMLAVKVMLLLCQVFPVAKQKKKHLDVSKTPTGEMLVNIGCPLGEGWAISYNIGSTQTYVYLTHVQGRREKNIRTVEDTLTNACWFDFQGWTFKAKAAMEVGVKQQQNQAYQTLRAAQRKSWMRR